MHDSRVRFVPVRLGLDDGRTVQIVSGLRPGEQVALNLPSELAEGALVQALPQRSSSDRELAPAAGMRDARPPRYPPSTALRSSAASVEGAVRNAVVFWMLAPAVAFAENGLTLEQALDGAPPPPDGGYAAGPSHRRSRTQRAIARQLAAVFYGQLCLSAADRQLRPLPALQRVLAPTSHGHGRRHDESAGGGRLQDAR